MSDGDKNELRGESGRKRFGDGPIALGVARLRALFVSPVAAIGFGLAVIAAGLLLRYLIGGSSARYITLYPAVAIAALIGGPISGLVATIVAAAISGYLYVNPLGSYALANDVVSLVNFTVTGLVICLIAAVDRSVAARMTTATRDLDSADARHRTIFEALHEGVIVFGPNAEVLSYNPSAERILGFAPGALASAVVTPSEWHLLHADGSRMAVADYPVMRAFTTGIGYHDEVIGHVLGDKTVWLLNNAAPLRDSTTGDIIGVIGSFVDITTRRGVERDLAESRAHLTSVFQALREGVVVFDTQGRTLSCNRSAETILRRSAAELIGVNGYLALGRVTVRADGSPFPVEERPIRHTLRTGTPARDVIAGIVDEAGTIWLQLNVEAILDPRDGAVVGAVASFTDITERLRQDRELAESRAHLASIFTAVHEGIVVFSQQGSVLSWNPSAERVLGLKEKDLTGLRSAFAERRLLREDGSEMPIDEFPAFRTLRSGEACHGMIFGAPVDGGHVWLLVNSEPIRDPVTGEVRAAVVSLNDVTERRRARQELIDSRARFASIVSSAMDAIVTVDADQRIVLFNAAAERMFGVTAAEAMGRSLETFIPTRYHQRHHDGFAGFAAETGTARRMARSQLLTARRADGSEFPIEASISRVIVDGQPLFTVIHRDISERLEAERTDAELATVVKSSPDAILTADVDGRITTWNDAAVRLFGYTPEEILGKHVSLLTPPNRASEGFGPVSARVLAGETVQMETIRRRADGRTVEVLLSVAPIRNVGGDVIALMAILTDISERRQRERQLTERDQELRQTLDAAGLGVWWIDADDAAMHCDPRSRSLFGVAEAVPLTEVAEQLHGDDRVDFLTIRETLAAPHVDQPLVLRTSAVDGSTVWLSLTARLRRTALGGEEIWGTVQDITEQHRAEQALKQLEASRRLEALGRMTGGIAHDFNNLLTIISGNLQLLDLAPDDAAARRWIAEALKATESGAALNNRLITFARRRQLDPTLCDLNDLVGSMIDLLHRSVGIHITVSAVLGADLGAVRVDPSEIENAILNLVLNARDAMPTGGRILIETHNTVVDESMAAAETGARPGQYLRLTVSDTGMGMTQAVKARAFEPFFTTKEVGRGSGLGLATLHGFVRQSGGFVTLYSEVGHGTTVNIYLPRVATDSEVATVAAPPTAQMTRGAGEKILLVEDNPGVARVTRERLTALGYRVTTATDATEALAVLSVDRKIDLVFTDVIMPGGMSGLDLARRLRAEDPTRRVLLTSGFAEEIARGDDGPEIEFPILRKPYALAELSRTIAEALGRPSTTDRPSDGRSA